MVGVIAFQIPNCKMVFADDPNHTPKDEDSQLAWSMKMFLEHPDNDPKQMLIFPMSKACLNIMKAV
jgi:PhoPQ-activated pathogenicity-related protein